MGCCETYLINGKPGILGIPVPMLFQAHTTSDIFNGKELTA